MNPKQILYTIDDWDMIARGRKGLHGVIFEIMFMYNKCCLFTLKKRKLKIRQNCIRDQIHLKKIILRRCVGPWYSLMVRVLNIFIKIKKKGHYRSIIRDILIWLLAFSKHSIQQKVNNKWELCNLPATV